MTDFARISKNDLPQIRKVERPESTTHLVEVQFHEIKSAEEAKNVLDGVAEEDIITFGKFIGEISFEPWTYFMIKREGIPATFWFKYCAPLRVLKPEIYEEDIKTS